MLDAEDSARRRIAQLIHDDSLQNLLAANQELMEAAPGRVQVQRAHEVVEGTIARLREAMMALHPVTLEQGGFETALGAVARQAARQGGFNVELDIDPEALDIADDLLLAIARELLTNAARHSKAEEVTVVLRKRARRSSSRSSTTAAASSAAGASEALSEGHIGLASVHERVRSVNGDFAVESSPAGTRAIARLPLATSSPQPAGGSYSAGVTVGRRPTLPGGGGGRGCGTGVDSGGVLPGAAAASTGCCGVAPGRGVEAGRGRARSGAARLDDERRCPPPRRRCRPRRGRRRRSPGV